MLGYDNPTPDQPVSCGRYQLVERIGYGGMAEIFRARLAGPNGFSKTVVVKRILPRLLDDDMIVKMFVEEARIAAAADHDNIAKVFELGKADDGGYFIVMEYLAGIDLEMLMRSAAQRSLQVPIWFTLQVVSEVLEALSFVHSLVDDQGRPRNVIHRDVTPSNIFVTYLGRVKLSDFGIADFAGKTPTTVAGQLKGKLAYMSPEQLNARTLDQRSDLFTVGVMLWEMLTQQRLFGQLNEMQAMLAICDGERTPPSQIRSDVPEALDEIALKALATDRDQRFGTAAEFQSALLDLLHEMRGPVRQSDVKHVVQVLLGREEPDLETVASAVTVDPNASFLLRLDQSERRMLADAAKQAMVKRQASTRSAPELEEDETLQMRSFEDGGGEFFVKSPGSALAGPMSYQDALRLLLEAARDERPASISIDQRRWLDLIEFGRLSGQDLVIDDATLGTSTTMVGSLEQRSVAAVFGLISRDRPTGKLSIANAAGDEWYEIFVANGHPVGVATNVSSMQLPALLVSRKVMSSAEVDRWLHSIVKSGRAESVMPRDVFMRARMAELFRWAKAEYTFQVEPTPRPGSPIARSLLALLPELVESACSTEMLKARLDRRIGKPLEPSWRFADAMEEMDLPLADRAIVDRLKSGRSIAQVLEAQPALAKRTLVIGYVMLEADLLLEALEE